MRRVLLLVLLAGITGSALAQNVDSLRMLSRSKTDTLSITGLNELCWYFKYSNPDSAFYFGNTARNKARKTTYTFGEAKANNNLGIVWWGKGQYDSALVYIREAKRLFENLNNYRGVCGAYINMGLLKQNMGLVPEALEDLHTALRLQEQHNISEYLAPILSNMGNAYQLQGDFANAKKYYLKSYLNKKQNNSPTLHIAEQNLGIAYQKEHNLDSALLLYESALKTALANKSWVMVSDLYLNIGTVYYERGEYKLAKNNYIQAKNFNKLVDNELSKSIATARLSEVHRATNQYDSAMYYAIASLASAQKINHVHRIKDAYFEAYLASVKQKKLDESFKYFTLYNQYRDSAFNADKQGKIAEIEARYETGKKEQEITSLKQKNTIQELASSRQRIYYAGALLIAGVAGISVFQFQKNRRFKEKTTLQLELQKQQEQAARDVIDAEMNERRRIASELHDGVGQIFSAARMNLSGIHSTIRFSNTSHQQVFDRTLTMIDEGCQELRSISHAMMPEALLKKGLPEALRELVNRIDQAKLVINLEIFGIESRLTQSLETNIYRIVQEAISNTLKHAEASTMDIQLGLTDNKLDLTVEDNGKGFALPSLDSAKGIGLKNIVSRVNILNGTIDIDTQPGKGTLLAITIPHSAA